MPDGARPANNGRSCRADVLDRRPPPLDPGLRPAANRIRCAKVKIS
ncbi:hypothetical protein I550_4186 [Mycobacterium intracellulare 1956]|uniref:Uncharacterized protein n=1 Tax=Mycobacterium intracellulare 1956 TaxID=1299331 RepID=X8CKQ3_MYCIT|nr:hypothetical protein I550_4186 [Mycobacterium intracellulare 1956]